jgi:hypothetical protein
MQQQKVTTMLMLQYENSKSFLKMLVLLRPISYSNILSCLKIKRQNDLYKVLSVPHIATSTWLSLFAVKDNPQCFSDIKLPLPVQTPKCLACIPEFIMGNITDFTQFLHRFKDQIFEVGHK